MVVLIAFGCGLKIMMLILPFNLPFVISAFCESLLLIIRCLLSNTRCFISCLLFYFGVLCLKFHLTWLFIAPICSLKLATLNDNTLVVF